MALDILIIALCLSLMLIGLGGTFLPVIPGIPIIWLGYLIYGLYSSWAHYGYKTIIITGLAVVFSIIVEQLASVIGAKKFGAQKAGMIGAFVGAILGAIFFSLPGLIFGTFLGAMGFEILFNNREFKQAAMAGTGALLGFLAGSFFKFILGSALIFSFLYLIFFT